MKPSAPDASAKEAPPNVPFFATWRGVYSFVFGFFVFCVVILALFSRHYA